MRHEIHQKVMRRSRPVVMRAMRIAFSLAQYQSAEERFSHDAEHRDTLLSPQHRGRYKVLIEQQLAS